MAILAQPMTRIGGAHQHQSFGTTDRHAAGRLGALGRGSSLAPLGAACCEDVTIAKFACYANYAASGRRPLGRHLWSRLTASRRETHPSREGMNSSSPTKSAGLPHTLQLGEPRQVRGMAWQGKRPREPRRALAGLLFDLSTRHAEWASIGAMYALPKPGYDPETMRVVALAYRRERR